MGGAVVARAAERGVRHRAVGVARHRGGAAGGGGCQRAAARARRLRLRLRGGGLRHGIRACVRRAHEPGCIAGGSADRPVGLAARQRVRFGANARRCAWVRGAAGHAASAVAAGRDAAGRQRGAGRGDGTGGSADGAAGAGVLRRVGGARSGAPRSRGADQARPAHRRPHLRRGE